LIGAIEANVIEQFPLVSADLPQIEVHEEPDMLWVITNVPHSYLNCVLRTQLPPDGVDARIKATLAHFKSRQLPMTWRIGPSNQPADLGRRLIAHGLMHIEATIGMAVDLLALKEDLPAPSGLTVERVGDVETLRRWLRPVSVSFGHPDSVANTLFDVYASSGFGTHLPFRLYIGLLEGEVVAASRLYVGAGVAGIHGVATVPRARRQGIGTAMTLAPLREARSMGCRIGVLRASQMGLGMYRRLGFEEYCRFGIYKWTSGTEES
jgi:GNAT superfamily N-acetyltransferase